MSTLMSSKAWLYVLYHCCHFFFKKKLTGMCTWQCSRRWFDLHTFISRLFQEWSTKAPWSLVSICISSLMNGHVSYGSSACSYYGQRYSSNLECKEWSVLWEARISGKILLPTMSASKPVSGMWGEYVQFHGPACKSDAMEFFLVIHPHVWLYQDEM
jgi:hypothetical protein